MNKPSANNPKPATLAARAVVYIAVGITVFTLGGIVFYIVVNGVPNLSWDLFAWEYNSENVSLMPALINTLLMTVASLIIAVPLGIAAAIYLVEYTKRGNRLVKIIRATTETLSGIPSIVYGLFGMLFFVTYLGWGLSLLAGAFTLSIMILPLIMSTTEEALKSVPDAYREGSFGLGAGKLRTILRIVLPSAIPGILAGVILAIGRIVGESAALIYTAGTIAKLPGSVLDSVRTLSVHMFTISTEGLHMGKAFATALVLLIIVVGINALSAWAAKRISRKA